MKKLTLYGLFALMLAGLAAPVQAKDKHKDKHKDHHHGHYDDYRYDYDRRPVVKTRTIWVIEGGRPVKRVVYVDSRGRYYRKVWGRPVYVTQRYYESYPSKYYYSDGRRRAGVTIRF